MFRRKRPADDDRYQHVTLGNMIVERVQLPHTLVTVDKDEYHAMTWRYSLRIENGPVLFERNYVKASDAAIEAFGQMLKECERVDERFIAEMHFYQDLASKWRMV